MNSSTHAWGNSLQPSGANRWRFAPRATTMALVASALTILLNWPGAASATPALNFNSDVTKASFANLNIIYGWRYDFFRRPPPGNDLKLRFIVRDPADYYVVTNTVSPGGYSGWHTHPGPSIVLVKSGVATVYDGDDPTCTPEVYPAGSGFVDPGDGHVHMVRNEDSDTLVTEAFQVIPEGDARRIDAASPGNCPF